MPLNSSDLSEEGKLKFLSNDDSLEFCIFRIIPNSYRLLLAIILHQILDGCDDESNEYHIDCNGM